MVIRPKHKHRVRAELIEECGALIAELRGLYAVPDDPRIAADEFLAEHGRHLREPTELGAALREIAAILNEFDFDDHAAAAAESQQLEP